MEELLRYRGKTVTSRDVVFIKDLIARNPTASRRGLSRLLCEAWDWRQPNGVLRDMVCRGYMLALHREGLIELPPIRQHSRNPLAQRKRPSPHVDIDQTPVEGDLASVKPLEFRQVRRTSDEGLFASLIEQFHFLRYVQPVGEHLKHMVFSKGRPLACFAWSSAPRHLGVRDRFIGWSPEARRRNIRFIAYNSRFLIMPWVSVRCLASHILGCMARIVPQDWEAVYGHPVYYLETFTDPARYKGTCYKAANWIVLGQTSGRGNNAPTHEHRVPVKLILGYPLSRRFRELLSADVE